MNSRLRLGVMSVCIFLCTGLITGCVERRFVVVSSPPGAMVLVNNQRIGAAPADEFFVYHGKYHIVLVKDGYETLSVIQNVAPRWYEYWPIDFISENIWPLIIRDVRVFPYTMQPAQAVLDDPILGRATDLRNQGQGLGSPKPAPTPRPQQ